jgi:hypothetical protein
MTDQPQRDPNQWKTGDEPMTANQSSYLRTLSEEAGEPFDENLTKAEASKRIDALQNRSPRLGGDDDAGGTDASAAGTAPRPSQAEGADVPSSGSERPPRPSQAEGDRESE